ncbi:GreA/GreB family elongation factor [Horticoccus luteus]|uniref:GreA/GreB family elongation factor n=1 Tax=Horticoccus luteus TaxID=2862869 RepID=A0A8F9TVN0_9BACT|nr:GreA/GreB family elongation factor [Horticoccus luteus]QYM79920.1 GreA/GreB family elongation factor [Horticoccus luteus]
MSKAFLREDDLQPEPASPPALPLSLLIGGKHYLTPRGAAVLQEEITRLSITERPGLAARAASDADEKAELQRLDSRVRQLQLTLQTAEIVPPPPPPHDVVQFGATVTVESKTGGVVRYRIVGVDEADPAAGTISHQSPIARALLNAHRDSSVEFSSPAGRQELRVTDISYE